VVDQCPRDNIRSRKKFFKTIVPVDLTETIDQSTHFPFAHVVINNWSCELISEIHVADGVPLYRRARGI
jgi:hypothetical protein